MFGIYEYELVYFSFYKTVVILFNTMSLVNRKINKIPYKTCEYGNCTNEIDEKKSIVPLIFTCIYTNNKKKNE